MKLQFSLKSQIISNFVILTFVSSLILPPSKVQAQTAPALTKSGLNLPVPGTMVPLSESFFPVVIKGIKVFPEDPLKFDFIMNMPESELEGADLENKAFKLVKYFLASLTVPEKDLWVNLSPYEENRIIPEQLGQTEMGRDLLAQDYLLKQLTASLMYPEEELGEEFWDRIYKESYEKFGTTDVPINTFHKVWIIPDKAVVHEQGTTAFVTESYLKVMLEKDYLASQKGTKTAPSSQEKDDLESKIIKEVIIPAIEEEVNYGKNFILLRQIYHSLILAKWFKTRMKSTLLGKNYADKSKIVGIELEDKDISEKIYQQYVESFKVGVYDLIREEYDPMTESIIPRKYFSGGLVLETPLVIQNINGVSMAMLVNDSFSKVASFTVRINPISSGDKSMSSAADDLLVKIKRRVKSESFTIIDEPLEELKGLIGNDSKAASQYKEAVITFADGLLEKIKDLSNREKFNIIDGYLEQLKELSEEHTYVVDQFKEAVIAFADGLVKKIKRLSDEKKFNIIDGYLNQLKELSEEYTYVVDQYETANFYYQESLPRDNLSGVDEEIYKRTTEIRKNLNRGNFKKVQELHIENIDTVKKLSNPEKEEKYGRLIVKTFLEGQIDSMNREQNYGDFFTLVQNERFEENLKNFGHLQSITTHKTLQEMYTDMLRKKALFMKNKFKALPDEEKFSVNIKKEGISFNDNIAAIVAIFSINQKDTVIGKHLIEMFETYSASLLRVLENEWGKNKKPSFKLIYTSEKILEAMKEITNIVQLHDGLTENLKTATSTYQTALENAGISDSIRKKLLNFAIYFLQTIYNARSYDANKLFSSLKEDPELLQYPHLENVYAEGFSYLFSVFKENRLFSSWESLSSGWNIHLFDYLKTFLLERNGEFTLIKKVYETNLGEYAVNFSRAIQNQLDKDTDWDGRMTTPISAVLNSEPVNIPSASNILFKFWEFLVDYPVESVEDVYVETLENIFNAIERNYSSNIFESVREDFMKTIRRRLNDADPNTFVKIREFLAHQETNPHKNRQIDAVENTPIAFPSLNPWGQIPRRIVISNNSDGSFTIMFSDLSMLNNKTISTKGGIDLVDTKIDIRQDNAFERFNNENVLLDSASFVGGSFDINGVTMIPNVSAYLNPNPLSY